MDNIWDYELAVQEAREEAKIAKQEAKQAVEQAAKAAKIATAEGIRKIAKSFRDNGVAINVIVKSSGLTKEEILAL